MASSSSGTGPNPNGQLTLPLKRVYALQGHGNIRRCFECPICPRLFDRFEKGTGTKAGVLDHARNVHQKDVLPPLPPGTVEKLPNVAPVPVQIVQGHGKTRRRFPCPWCAQPFDRFEKGDGTKAGVKEHAEKRHGIEVFLPGRQSRGGNGN